MSRSDEPSVTVVDNSQGLSALLSPLRRKLLKQLHAEADSATGLGRKMGLPRQRINYHLKKLENAGLLEVAGETQRRGCTERHYKPTARAYLISPVFAEELGVSPSQLQDRFSSAYLIALGAQLVRDLGQLRKQAKAAGKPLATLALQLDIRFSSARQRSAFAKELTETVARLATRYQSQAPGGRTFCFMIGGYPVVPHPSPTRRDSNE